MPCVEAEAGAGVAQAWVAAVMGADQVSSTG